ncbi:MAG: HAMP domain-containing histidine kinase [Spirochaetes bacterium]|nr:MAG: HAMP domain-containing histidine kinase [Spirochaetota bacterium]
MDRKGVFRKLRGSLFARLLAVIVLLGVVINLAVGAFFRTHFAYRGRAVFARNMSAYIGYLVRDIGLPPDLGVAEKRASDLLLYISISGRGVEWTSPGGTPADRRTLERLRPFGEGKAGVHLGRMVYVVEKEGYTFVFVPRGDAAPDEFDASLLLLIALLCAALAGTWFAIRRILGPLTLIARGVRETARGNFDNALPVRGADELAALSDSFNSMNTTIARMLRSREQLLLDVSHELRSPLTRLRLACELIDDPNARAGILDDVNVLEGMVRELLESERLDHPAGAVMREPVDISALVREAAATAAGGRYALGQEGAPPPAVRGDRERLGIVFRNVIENAVKFTPADGPPISIAISHNEDSIVVEVRDGGPGIGPEDLPFIFEPFYRADRARSHERGGYGLGLYLCKRIVEAHGGSIEATSAPGKGTAIRVSLPAG